MRIERYLPSLILCYSVSLSKGASGVIVSWPAGFHLILCPFAAFLDPSSQKEAMKWVTDASKPSQLKGTA